MTEKRKRLDLEIAKLLSILDEVIKQHLGLLHCTRLHMAHSCPGRVRQHVRSWRMPTPHSKAHPLVNRLNFA